MKIRNRHERFVAASTERIAALIADFDYIWPGQLAPAPRTHGRIEPLHDLILEALLDNVEAAAVFGQTANTGR